MTTNAERQRRRRQDPAVREQKRLYKKAYAHALARLRDQHRGQFAAFLREELADLGKTFGSQPVESVTSGNGAASESAHRLSTGPGQDAALFVHTSPQAVPKPIHRGA